MTNWIDFMIDVLLTSLIMVAVYLILFIVAVRMGVFVWVFKKVRALLKRKFS
jgi:hypothetical protein